MQACSAQMADFIRSQIQTPTGFAIVQLPVPGTGIVGANGIGGLNPRLINNQFVLDKMTSVQITRSTDRTSDTCNFTLQDDKFQYAPFRTDGQSKYGIAFQPGVLENTFQIYLGFQGLNYANEQGVSGGSSITNPEYATLLRFTGTLQTDDNPWQNFANTKSVSLVDLTNRFQFDVYDTFPHPIYGNQNLPYFDPSYNLTNGPADGVTWSCIGKMFTLSSDSLVYGSTHITPAFFVDFTCGQNPVGTPLKYDHSHLDDTGTSPTFIGTYYDASNNILWTFDYPNGKITFTNAWITARMGDSQPQKIASLTANSHAGDNVFSVTNAGNFVVGGTVVLGMPTDAHQEQLTIKSIQLGAQTITTSDTADFAHSSGDPAMGNWTVSMAGNPTYMAPETMIELILVNKGNWDPSMLKLSSSGLLINQYVGQDMAAWDCIKEICDLTCPRFVPWIMYVDANGVLHFEESMYDSPVVKTYVDKRDFLTCDLSYSSQTISTVVRAEGDCYTDQGAQSVTSIAFNMKAINRYGQTEPLLLDQHLTYNCRQMTTTQAVAYMNMLTMSVLGQVSEPTLTLTAEIWPDPTLEINDKIRVYDSDLGMDSEFIISAITENVTPGSYSMKITAQEVLQPANYMVGLPAAVTYDNLLLPATATPPATSLVKEVVLGTGVGTYVYKDWQPTQSPVTLRDLVGTWAQDGSAMNFNVFFDAKKPVQGNNPYSYANLPPGIDWSPSTDPNTGATVYYAVQPSPPQGTPSHPGWYLYVGPDSIFYTFDHTPPIQPGDLGSFWLPPGNDHVPGKGTGTQAWHGYVWQWFYLCLDGSEGSGKQYRPVMLLRPNDTPHTINVQAGQGVQVNSTWTKPPGPSNDLSSFYYGNVVVGISNFTPAPPGFYGVQVYGGGRAKGECRLNWPDGNQGYTWLNGNKQAGGPGWMPPGQTVLPVTNSSRILPGDLVSLGVGPHTGDGGGREGNIPVLSVQATTITIDTSYNSNHGTKWTHYGGPTTQGDAPPQKDWYNGAPQAPVIPSGPSGGMPDTLEYGVSFGKPIQQQDTYVNYQKETWGMYCLYVMSTDGASQFLRLPFKVLL